MNDLMTFPTTDQAVHMFTDTHGRLWLRATDLCTILQLSNPWEVVQRHAKRYVKDWQVGHGRPAQYVTEPGMYRLIFASKAPVAEAFQDWVFDEVLPSIRQAGSYQVPKAKEASAPMAEEGTLADAVIERMLQHMLTTSDPTQISQISDGVHAAIRSKVRGGASTNAGRRSTPVEGTPLVDRIVKAIDTLVDRYGEARWSSVVNYVKVDRAAMDAVLDSVIERCGSTDIASTINGRGVLIFFRAPQ